jgi:hypothetical protein
VRARLFMFSLSLPEEGLFLKSGLRRRHH